MPSMIFVRRSPICLLLIWFLSIQDGDLGVARDPDGLAFALDKARAAERDKELLFDLRQDPAAGVAFRHQLNQARAFR